MSPEELKAKIDLLHSRLTQDDDLDDSWRTIGQWPEGEHGSILHPPATEEEIAQAEARFGHKFPPLVQGVSSMALRVGALLG